MVHCVYTFLGSCPLTEFCQLQYNIHFASKSCVLLYWQSYCTALEQRPSAKLWLGTRNGIAALSQRQPPTFGWEAITLGICAHTSLLFSSPILSGCKVDAYHTSTHDVVLVRI